MEVLNFQKKKNDRLMQIYFMLQILSSEFWWCKISKTKSRRPFKWYENVDIIFRLKQLDNQKARIASDLQEMDKPMARSVDDEDRDAHLKAVEREEDPMLQYIRKKKTQKQASSGLPRKLVSIYLL